MTASGGRRLASARDHRCATGERQQAVARPGRPDGAGGASAEEQEGGDEQPQCGRRETQERWASIPENFSKPT